MNVRVNYLGFLSMLCLCWSAHAQYSNSWINFNQQYYKIAVAQEGIYRLSYTDLQNAGFPVNSVDPRFIQLFHRGQQQSIYVKGQGDGVFNTTDYIEFYGQKNDGTLDSILYKPYSLQPHKHYNLYSDTAAYFLTYNFVPPIGLRADSIQLVNVNNTPAESYQYSQRLFVLHDQYSAGYTFQDYTQATAFDQGEGWTGVAIQQGQSIDYTIDSLYNRATSGGNPILEMLLVGRDAVPHAIQVWVGANSSSLRLLESPNFNNFETYKINDTLQWSDVGSNGNMLVRIIAQSATTNRYQVSASYIKVTFPQNFNFTGIKKKKFQLAAKANGQSYLSITNTNNFRLWDISNLQNITRILPTSINPFNAMVTGTSVSKKLYLSVSYNKPIFITPVSFRQIDPSSANFLIITNRSLMHPTSSYSNPVQAYAAYRASSDGGSFDTLTVTVDQLYNQFNYGETSPGAIYRFINFMSQGNVKYLFLIGKGRDIWSYSPYQRNPLATNEFVDLVPSAGYPGGDIAYTAGLNGTTYNPSIATGRLSVSTSAQVAAYLDKIKQHESVSLQPWTKELLHLSGGGNAAADFFELELFHAIVNGFAQIAEGPYLGGHVTTIAKDQLGIEQVNVSPSVNTGVNLITFFGHASSNIYEIDIGNVDDQQMGYNNNGKYPVFLFNGCDAGAVFGNNVALMDNWTNTANKGSRNYIASSSYGFSNLLQQYSTLFYQVAFADSSFIKKGIGDIQKELCKRYLKLYPSDISDVAQVQQMILGGDPAVKLIGTNLPDYAINNSSLSLISYDQKPVTSLSDSFAVQIIVKNLAAYQSSPIKIQVVRTFSDNTSVTYDSTFAPVLYSDTLLFKIQKGDKNGFGNNLFTVVIDPLNTIKEVTKTNNIATLSVFIPSNGTINIYPPNFGIVSTTSPSFVFQDANLLGAQRNFQLQIDTTIYFNSQFLIDTTLSSKVLVRTNVSLLNTDSTVYYWRTKPANENTSDSSSWNNSSFVFINHSNEGWAQKKLQQINQNVLTNLQIDGTGKNFIYPTTVTQVSVKSIGANSASSYSSASLKIDSVEYVVSNQVGCRNNTINIVAFNKKTATPYPGIYFYYDGRGCGLQPPVINSFLSTEVNSGSYDLLQSIDGINPNDSVVLFSIGNPSFSQWSTDVLTKLTELGISNSQMASLQDGEPVVIFAKKGATAGSAKIYTPTTSPVTSQDESVTATITGHYSSGNIKSVAIGPAKNWVKFWAQTKTDDTDQISYSIYGVDVNGYETLIQNNVSNNYDLSFINAQRYPQLKVQISMHDSINLSAAQLQQWFVFYESVAEGLLFYRGALTQQTLQEGQVFNAQYGFTNISTKSFTDSLQVQTEIVNMTQAANQNNIFKINAPAPGDTTLFSFPIDTKGKAGLNNVNVYVNPKIQPEQTYDNNSIYLNDYLNVLTDQTHPLIDVTVDGRYLQNGDYVSPSPVIQIKLQDDNPFLFVTDTTHLNVLLSYPCDTTLCPYTRIKYNRSDLVWKPATANSDFTVNFHPTNLPEGIYTLQVNGSDASGNTSGVKPYEISFEVKYATTLTLYSVYPNPSNSIFNFAFQLSGNVLPDDFSLRIYSSDGKMIHNYNTNDVANFIIGKNDLQWNASQENGSGLYIYKLTMSVNGKSVSQSGKLVLVK